jgi:hypothetical protein
MSRPFSFRPNLESLESRSVPSASPGLSAVRQAPVLTHVARASDVRLDSLVGYASYEVLSIKNSSRITFKYQFSFGGARKSFSLAPGQTRVHFTQADNIRPSTRFDSSTRSGFQQKIYQLDAETRRYMGAAKPRPGQGILYEFVSRGRRDFDLVSTG